MAKNGTLYIEFAIKAESKIPYQWYQKIRQIFDIQESWQKKKHVALLRKIVCFPWKTVDDSKSQGQTPGMEIQPVVK